MGTQRKEEKISILLELAERNSLFFYIHSQKGLPENLALRFLFQTALALEYLHSRGIVHRDIKPENILLFDDFTAKICDFGWSCQMSSGSTLRRSVCGTYEYMSPEVLAQSAHSFETDVWALGILLYEMLHGAPPYRANSLAQMRNETKSRPIVFSPSISPLTHDLLSRMLQRDQRFRLSIRQILAHPAIASQSQIFSQSLDPSDIALLHANFQLNTNRPPLVLSPPKILDVITPPRLPPTSVYAVPSPALTSSATNYINIIAQYTGQPSSFEKIPVSVQSRRSLEVQCFSVLFHPSTPLPPQKIRRPPINRHKHGKRVRRKVQKEDFGTQTETEPKLSIMVDAGVQAEPKLSFRPSGQKMILKTEPRTPQAGKFEEFKENHAISPRTASTGGSAGFSPKQRGSGLNFSAFSATADTRVAFRAPPKFLARVKLSEIFERKETEKGITKLVSPATPAMLSKNSSSLRIKLDNFTSFDTPQTSF